MKLCVLRPPPPVEYLATAMSAGEESLYSVLLDRFRSLEASYSKLREQFDVVVQERSKGMSVALDAGWGCVPWYFSMRSPHRSVLELMGHAVYVCTASSGEIIYWNHSAQELYGWKDCEVLGQRAADLIEEEYNEHATKIMEKLSSGQSWSGQFRVKKRTGDIFLAIGTKSPLYEDGELVGIITVTSDAAVFNSITLENLKIHQNRANGLPRVKGLTLKKIQWHPPPKITSVPQIASSVSNLASKALLRRQGDDMCNASPSSGDTEKMPKTANVKLEKPKKLEAKPKFGLQIGNSRTIAKSLRMDESAFEFPQPSEVLAKVLSKLQIVGDRNCGKEKDGSLRQNDSTDGSEKIEEQNEPSSPLCPKAQTSCQCNVDTGDKGVGPHKSKPLLATTRASSNLDVYETPNACKESFAVFDLSGESHECFGLPRHGNLSPFSFKAEPKIQNLIVSEIEDALQRQPDVKQSTSSGDSLSSSHESSSSKGETESNSRLDCEICWEDLQLREEVGQGFYAVVHRGIWNGSDVAVKIFFQNEYCQGTIIDYKKEIDIIRRLRHPNVLLFMGAVYSHERLAIVTEFLPRGSLFRTLHKNNQVLDIKRRLRMALDVARGMNYLHHRNPPIVHRDLKSSNLLVGKNWNVKVGDFGLSKFKNATLLTPKSGRGTPQWMAPEVLRNEPSNEKSDVFSFGVILWELMTESIPWNHLSSLQVVGVVGFMDRRLDLPEGLDPLVSSIIHDCWQSDPLKRPSFEKIIQTMKEIIHKISVPMS